MTSPWPGHRSGLPRRGVNDEQQLPARMGLLGMRNSWRFWDAGILGTPSLSQGTIPGGLGWAFLLSGDFSPPTGAAPKPPPSPWHRSAPSLINFADSTAGFDEKHPTKSQRTSHRATLRPLLMIFSLWFWFGISSPELKEAACPLDCNDFDFIPSFSLAPKRSVPALGTRQEFEIGRGTGGCRSLSSPILAPNFLGFHKAQLLPGTCRDLLLSPRRICSISSWDTPSVSSGTSSRCHLVVPSFGKGLLSELMFGSHPRRAPSLDPSSSLQYGCILSLELWKDFVPSSRNFYDSFVCI